MVFSEREFVDGGAQAVGMSDLRLIVRELLPNLVPSLLAYSLLLVAVRRLPKRG